MVLGQTWRKSLRNGILVIVVLVVSALLCEMAAQFYVYNIAMQGKLFRPDDELGWSLLPNNDLVRLNHDGAPWHISTDERGVRGPSSWPVDGSRRMLILGDSFAFGEGVDLHNRFDTLLARQIQDLAIVNIGVMGYGTDQEFIQASNWADQLNKGDILLILTYCNDFFDIVKTHHSGRSKPWFESKAGNLVLHKPDIGVMEIVRDRSYILSLLASKLNVDRQKDLDARLQRAGELYEQILEEQTRKFRDRGVDVVLVYHGRDVFNLPFYANQIFASSCELVTTCMSLDLATSQFERSEIFLSDGHWNEGGHRVAAEQIVQHLQQHYANLDELHRNDDPKVTTKRGD